MKTKELHFLWLFLANQIKYSNKVFSSSKHFSCCDLLKAKKMSNQLFKTTIEFQFIPDDLLVRLDYTKDTQSIAARSLELNVCVKVLHYNKFPLATYFRNR